MSNELWKYGDGWGEGQSPFQNGDDESGEYNLDEGDFVNMLQVDINHNIHNKQNHNVNAFPNVKRSPTSMSFPPDGGDYNGLGDGVGTVDPSIFNFNYSLPFDIPVDPTLQSGEVSPRTVPVPLLPSPAVAHPLLSAPETPIIGHLSHPMVPTQSQMPSLIFSRAPSLTPAPTLQDIDDEVIVGDDGHMHNQEQLPTTPPSALAGTSAIAAATATPQAPELPTVSYESQSATIVQTKTDDECISSLSYNFLPPSHDDTLPPSADDLRVYSAVPSPPPSITPQHVPSSHISRISEIANTTANGDIRYLTYPHDHHVVFTCGHEDRFFTYVESHLKMCICNRISRLYTDIHIADRERANMAGEIGAWRLVGAGIEKEYVDGICQLCMLKEKKEKIAAIKKGGDGVRKGSSASVGVAKEAFMRSYKEGGGGGGGKGKETEKVKKSGSGVGATGGGLVKNKRPYKKRKQMLEAEMLCESITLRHNKRQKQ